MIKGIPSSNITFLHLVQHVPLSGTIGTLQEQSFSKVLFVKNLEVIFVYCNFVSLVTKWIQTLIEFYFSRD